MAKQQLSPKAAAAKKKRDLAFAKTPRRRKMKAENQRKRRAAKKAGKSVANKDYDHNTNSFVSVKKNRSATKTTNNTMPGKKKPTLKSKVKTRAKSSSLSSKLKQPAKKLSRPKSGPYSKAAQDKRRKFSAKLNSPVKRKPKVSVLKKKKK